MPYLPWERVFGFGPAAVFRCRDCGAVYLQVAGWKRRLSRVSCRSHIRDIDPTFERRRHPRRDVSPERAVECTLTTDRSVLTGKVVNICPEGVQVETGEPLGEERVTLAIGPDHGLEREIRVRGKVVYIRKRGEKWYSGIRAGIDRDAFERLSG